MQNALEDLTPDEQEMLQAALEALSGRLQALMDWLTSGEGPSKEELEELARQAGARVGGFAAGRALGDAAHAAAYGFCPSGRAAAGAGAEAAGDGHEPGGD